MNEGKDIKVCGNCRFNEHEKSEGIGYCERNKLKTHCDRHCAKWELLLLQVN